MNLRIRAALAIFVRRLWTLLLLGSSLWLYSLKCATNIGRGARVSGNLPWVRREHGRGVLGTASTRFYL